MHHRILPLAAAVALSLGAPSAAQQASLVSVGARIRVMTADSTSGPQADWLIGRVVAVSADTLVLADEWRPFLALLAIPASEIRRVEMSEIVYRRIFLGAIAGALIGAIGGVPLAPALRLTESGCPPDCPNAASYAVGVGIGVFAGGLVGAAIGLSGAERWRPAYLPARGAARER